MHFSNLLWLAAVSVQAASVTRPGTALQPRDEFTSSSSSSMTTVVKTFGEVSTNFEQTRTSLESQTDIQGAVNVLNEFRQNLYSRIQQYASGCNCVANHEEGSAFSEMVKNWFLELERMIELVQQKWPTDYSQNCGQIFTEISSGLQTALAVGSDAGLDIRYLVDGLNLNEQLLSSVNIQTSSFTSFTYSSTTSGTASSGPALWRGPAPRIHINPIRPTFTPINRPFGVVPITREPYGFGPGPAVIGPKPFRTPTFRDPYGLTNPSSQNQGSFPTLRDPRGASINSHDFNAHNGATNVDPRVLGTSLAKKHN